jgi:branched-chain amino acid transport system permease protein
VGEATFWEFDWITLVIIFVTLAALATHALIRSSRFGRQMRVAAQSPEAAQTLRISPGIMRLAAFGIAAVMTGIAGALYAPLFGFVSPGAFPLHLSILLYFAVVVGGQGTLVGPIAGLYLLYLVPNVLLTGLVEYRLIIYGGIAFLAMMFFPDGLIGTVRDWLLRRGARERDRVVTLEPLVAGEPGDEPGAALAARDAQKRFGEVVALDGATLEVRPSEVHGLVGPNGSGKTTLLNALSGLVTLDAGEITLDGDDVTRRSPRARAGLGMGRSFQTPRVFEDMTVWENVDVTESPDDLLERYRADWDKVSSATLPHAQRRVLEIARVIATRPRVLLLDEPAAGLSPSERAEFGAALRRLAADGGATIVLVEHDLDLVWQVADTITVMDQGRVIASGDPATVRNSSAVETLFWGEAHAHRT